MKVLKQIFNIEVCCYNLGMNSNLFQFLDMDGDANFGISIHKMILLNDVISIVKVRY